MTSTDLSIFLEFLPLGGGGIFLYSLTSQASYRLDGITSLKNEIFLGKSYTVISASTGNSWLQPFWFNEVKLHWYFKVQKGRREFIYCKIWPITSLFQFCLAYCPYYIAPA